MSPSVGKHLSVESAFVIPNSFMMIILLASTNDHTWSSRASSSAHALSSIARSIYTISTETSLLIALIASIT